MKYFSSDWHLSHEKMCSVRTHFSSLEEMNSIIINNALSCFKPGDQFYFLGDLSWKQDTMSEMFKKWPHNVEFHWILGNHDKGFKSFRRYCRSIETMKEVKIGDNSVTLCHYPMVTWNKSHYNSWMLYGHHHSMSHGTNELHIRAPGKMLNVNVEFHEYKPWSEDEIIEQMKNQSDNWDIIRR